MAEPDIAVITNCSAEHLEGLGDLMGVRQEEASIIEGLNPKGLLVVNGDDEQLLEAVSRYPGNRVTFGYGSHNDLYATDIECGFDGVHFRLNGRRGVFIPLLGQHTACNALAAIGVARRLGLSEDEIVGALGQAHGPDMRLQLMNVRGITILNDAYNANPASTQAAIGTICALPASGRRIAVLGDMRELGESADRFHREIGQFAAEKPLDLLVCVGEKARLIAEEARQTGLAANRVRHFADTSRAAAKLPGWLMQGDLVLLKASRAMRFETIAQAIGAAPAMRAAS
jgi:UDP-N-acetylmuramoyl-tripeptide--D-alanyl-D-alanine ligase